MGIIQILENIFIPDKIAPDYSGYLVWGMIILPFHTYLYRCRARIQKQDLKLDEGALGCISIVLIFYLIVVLNWYLDRRGVPVLADATEVEIKQNQSSLQIIIGIWTMVVHAIYTVHKIYSSALQCFARTKKVIKEKDAITEREIHKCNKRIEEMERIAQEREELCVSRENDIKGILSCSDPFVIVASLQADLLDLVFDPEIRRLKYKSRPALKSAEVVASLKKKAKSIEFENKLLKYKYELLLNQFPELASYVDDYNELRKYTSITELQEDYDRSRDWLSKDEYENLSVDDRNQKALDNYIASRSRSQWQIGRDYEMYIAHLYRTSGFDEVCPVGVEKKFNDLGRDIVARKGKSYHIIQCKRWGQDKAIHENTICQLFGTTTMFSMEVDPEKRKGYEVIPVLVTTTKLSPTAQAFADRLGVLVHVIPMSDDFPRIKCNVNNGQKIYHLPFDQQYDSAKIETKDECFVSTVKEAVALGFRRAYRFKGL